jgi:hypothetical protein
MFTDGTFSGYANSNNTGLMSIRPPFAESITGHTHKQTDRQNKDILILYRFLNGTKLSTAFYAKETAF